MASQFATFLRWLLEKVDDGVDQPTTAAIEEAPPVAVPDPAMWSALLLQPEAPPGAGLGGDIAPGSGAEAVAVAPPPEDTPANASPLSPESVDAGLEPTASLAESVTEPPVEMRPESGPGVHESPEVVGTAPLRTSTTINERETVLPPAPAQPTPTPRPVLQTVPQFVPVRLPDAYARSMLPRQLATASSFPRRPQDVVAPQALPPGTLPRLGPDGVFRQSPVTSAQAPPAIQKWPAPVPTFNTFP